MAALQGEELVVAMRPGHELGGNTPLPLSALAGRRLIAFPQMSAERRSVPLGAPTTTSVAPTATNAAPQN